MPMLRMEIALILVLGFIAFIYFSSERKDTRLHRTFSMLLVVILFHLVFDTITVYTVNHLDTVNALFNEIVHRAFIGSMILVCFLFYRYIAILVEEETGKKVRFYHASVVYLGISQVANLILPIHYAVTPLGNYSDGIHVTSCYISIVLYFFFGITLLAVNWKKIETKKRNAIAVALMVEITASILQNFNPTWLISGMGLTLMTLSFYLTLENPDILRAELVEQKMSMLYLKSQVNPHFLYNTLDTIRIQAQLNGDKEVANLLMHLVDFFRLSVKVNRPMVELDDELELLEAYMELMCYRYPELVCEYDVDPNLGNVQVPNFILQPIVENSLLHGLKNKGYRGMVRISARQFSDKAIEVEVYDTGSGFSPEKKEKVDEMLRTYAKQEPKLEGNSIGVLNVQKRIKLLCGEDFGLSYTDNKEGGAVAHLVLPLKKEEE